MKFVDMKNDIAFKKVFGNSDKKKYFNFIFKCAFGF